MPTIYRPDTDAQLLQALQAAQAKANVTPAPDLAFSAATQTELNTFLPAFELEIQQRGNALTAQALATAAANPARKALNMVNRHFIQVFNFAVERGEWPAQERARYQLPVDYSALPKMTTDEENLRWAKNLIDGEAARVAAGGMAMSNPAATLVVTRRAALVTALGVQTNLKDAYDAEQKDVENMRGAAIELVGDIWDEVLFTYRKESASSQRRLAREYGVAYRPSPGETPTPEDFSLKGKVTEYLTPNPLVGVEVYIIEADQFATTDPNGDYIFGTLASGSYTVRFRLLGYLDYTQPNVAIANGVLSTLDVQMKREIPMP
jgi:hypothetical protein